MRDPFVWSLPLGRVFGIAVRVHLFFIVFILGMWLMAATNEELPEGAANAMLVLMGLVFASVLLHEFGHCYAAAAVGGHSHEVLLWPLGGLARSDIPQTPRAHFLTAAGGPAVNVLLCLASAGALVAMHYVPPLIPWPTEVWYTRMWNWADGHTYGGAFAAGLEGVHGELPYGLFLLGQFFWVNYFLFLLNVLLMGFPLDGGQMLQAALWPRMGYRQAMHTAVFVGFGVMFVICIIGIAANQAIWLLLAWFMYDSCKRQYILLETGADEHVFGYDFSQGYTSLEQGDEERVQAPRKQPNVIQRWLQKRAAKKMQKEMERAEAEERRMDELLDKIQKYGQASLTEEEHRFLKKVSDRYKNRP